MKNYKRGFASLIILLAIIIIAGASFFYYRKINGRSRPSQINSENTSTEKSHVPATTSQNTSELKDLELIKAGDKVGVFTVASINISRNYIDTDVPSSADIIFKGQAEVSGTYSQ